MILGGGAEDADRRGVPGAHRLQEGDPVHLRHHVVGDHDRRRLRLELGQGLFGPGVTARLEAGLLEGPAERLQDELDGKRGSVRAPDAVLA